MKHLSCISQDKIILPFLSATAVICMALYFKGRKENEYCIEYMFVNKE